MSDLKTRRQLLRSSVGWIGGATVLVAATSAGAAMQSVKVRPQSPLGIAIANRCKVASPDHDAIRARLTALLAANPSLGTLSEQCPICGCPIVVNR
jgi:hypothetical protein